MRHVDPSPPSKGGPTECGRAYVSLARGKYEAQIYSDDRCELAREELSRKVAEQSTQWLIVVARLGEINF